MLFNSIGGPTPFLIHVGPAYVSSVKPIFFATVYDYITTISIKLALALFSYVYNRLQIIRNDVYKIYACNIFYLTTIVDF